MSPYAPVGTRLSAVASWAAGFIQMGRNNLIVFFWREKKQQVVIAICLIQPLACIRSWNIDYNSDAKI